MPDFATHMQTLAQEFIGTVLFVDDQIPEKTESNGRLSGDNTLSGSLMLDLGPLQEPEDHILDIRKLSKSCSENGILCCPLHTEQILNEEQQQQLVDKVVKLAKKADVIVLDWQMESDAGSVAIGTTARKIIDKYKYNNPDRDILVCIFTAESIDKVNVDEMTCDNVKVFYVWKKEEESYEGLPQKIFREFAKRHVGILPSAAFSAIKVIRDNTHRLLSKYSSDKDAAYLSHRCLVENVNDAELFVTELLAASLGDLVRGNEKIIATVNGSAINKWLELHSANFIDYLFTIKGVTKKKINNEIRKEWLEKGISNWIKEGCKHHKQPKKQKIKQWESSHSLTLTKYFSNKTDAKDLLSLEAAFSRFASHVFFDDADKGSFSSFITLGSIVKKNNSNKYYLCIQPVCDSVRLEAKKSKFLFLSLESCEVPDEARAGFQIVVNDDKDVFLKVCERTSKLTVFEFSAVQPSGKVLSKANTIIKGFENNTQVDFKMLAQLRSEYAHRIVTKFMHNITRVGLDEPEWLRRHGTA